MENRGKVLFILLLLISLSACSSKNRTDNTPTGQTPDETKPSQIVVDSANSEYENSDETRDLKTDCIRIYHVLDFVDADDPTPTLEIRDPEQISSIINSVDFSKWKKVSPEEEYSSEPTLCVVFNDNVTIVMEETVPEGYGYLCKGIRSDKENENYHIEDSEGLYFFNDMFWETIQACLNP